VVNMLRRVSLPCRATLKSQLPRQRHLLNGLKAHHLASHQRSLSFSSFGRQLGSIPSVWAKRPLLAVPDQLLLVRRMATKPDTDETPKQQPEDDQQKNVDKKHEGEEHKKEEDEHKKKEEDEHKKEEEEQKREEREEKDDSHDRETESGYQQNVNNFQKFLAVLVPVAAIICAGRMLYSMREQGLDDDTLYVDMNAVMSHVFQSTVYNVLDSKKLTKMLGEPLMVEPTRAKFSFSKEFGWISYPLFGPSGQVATITVDLIRIDPTKSPKVKKPHMWYVAQIEADLNNGKKVLLSTKMEGIKQPFDVIKLFHTLVAAFNKEQQAAAAAEAATALKAAPADK